MQKILDENKMWTSVTTAYVVLVNLDVFQFTTLVNKMSRELLLQYLYVFS